MGRATDTELWAALEQAHLKEHAMSMVNRVYMSCLPTLPDHRRADLKHRYKRGEPICREGRNRYTCSETSFSGAYIVLVDVLGASTPAQIQDCKSCIFFERRMPPKIVIVGVG